MANQGISEILQEFQVNTPVDYHRLSPGTKGNFVSMLHGALRTHSDHSIGVIRDSPGMKMHFAVPSVKGEKTNLPSEVFLRKICMYSNKVVVTFPFHEALSPSELKLQEKHPAQDRQRDLVYFGSFDTERTGYGGEVSEHALCHHLERQEFDVFIQFLCAARKFIEHGILHVIPSYHPEAKRFKSASRGARGILSANFDDTALRRQFEEKGLSEDSNHELAGVRLLLPSFAKLSTDEVIRIREEDLPYFLAFQNDLQRLVSDFGRQDSEHKLLEKMQEIDARLIDLNRRVGKHLSTPAEKYSEFAKILLRIPILNLAVPVAGGIASVAELVAFGLGLGAYEKARAAELVKAADVFVMWHLQHPKYRLPW